MEFFGNLFNRVKGWLALGSDEGNVHQVMEFPDNLSDRVKGWLALCSDGGDDKKKCDVCGEPSEGELIPAPFNNSHHVCRDCVRLLFFTMVYNDNALPPNCCFEPFSYELVANLLNWLDYDNFESLLFDVKELEDHLQRAKLQYKPLDGIDSNKEFCPRCGRRTDAPCHAFSHLGRSDSHSLSRVSKPCPHCNRPLHVCNGWYHKTCV